MAENQFIREVLPGGIRLIIIPINGVNSVATSVLVAVGSRYEDPKFNGISHFLEHMVFKGTAKYPTTDDVNIVEKEGGIQNAYTDVDVTNFHNKVLSSDWKLGLEVNRELALAPRLEDKFLDLERNVILEEMKRYEDEPVAKLEETFHAMMFPQTRLGMRIIGTQDSLKRITGDILRGYHSSRYKGKKLVVVLAGKIAESEIKAVSDTVRAMFTGVEEGSDNGLEEVQLTQNQPNLNIVTKTETQQANLELGVRIFRRSSEERFAWSVFNILMGISFTSRLFREIREKRGLCYHVRSSSNNWQETGYWSVYAGVAPEKTEDAIKAILAELALARDKGVTEEEVMVSKKRIRTLLAFKSEDPEFINEFYGRQEIFGEKILTLGDYVSRIEKVTKDEIDNLLKKYLTAKTLNLAVVWNRSGGDSLRDLLKI